MVVPWRLITHYFENWHDIRLTEMKNIVIEKVKVEIDLLKTCYPWD